MNHTSGKSQEGAAAAGTAIGAPASEVVVLLHGMVAFRFCMRGLTNHLSQQGYHAINWGYFSFFDSIPKHAKRLIGLLEELDSNDQFQRVHFVTHSMGGIIVRYALTQYQPQKIGRFVMLAPPNQGSPVARVLSYIVGGIWPSLRELSDAPESMVNRLPQPEGIEIGVIASSPDHVVRLESTKLDNMADHIVARGPHRAVPFRVSTRTSVVSFLKNGRFRDS